MAAGAPCPGGLLQISQASFDTCRTTLACCRDGKTHLLLWLGPGFALLTFRQLYTPRSAS